MCDCGVKSAFNLNVLDSTIYAPSQAAGGVDANYNVAIAVAGNMTVAKTSSVDGNGVTTDTFSLADKVTGPWEEAAALGGSTVAPTIITHKLRARRDRVTSVSIGEGGELSDSSITRISGGRTLAAPVTSGNEIGVGSVSASLMPARAVVAPGVVLGLDGSNVVTEKIPAIFTLDNGSINVIIPGTVPAATTYVAVLNTTIELED